MIEKSKEHTVVNSQIVLPKKVFLVLWSDGIDSGVEKIFYNENKAKEYLKDIKKLDGLYYLLDEKEVEDSFL